MHKISYQSGPSSKRPERAGIIIVMFAIALTVLFIMIGFSIDLSYMQLTRAEMRLAADAAARSSALKLLTGGTEAEVIKAAMDIAEGNEVGGESMAIKTSDVELGYAAVQYDGTYDFTPTNSDPNAVRVTVRRTNGSQSGSISLYFGNLTGITDYQPVQQAIVAIEQVDICLVLDRSSSMKLPVESVGGGSLGSGHPDFCNPPLEGSRWLALDAAVESFVKTIAEGNSLARISIVSYSGQHSSCTSFAEDITIDQSLTMDRSLVRSAMKTLRDTNWNGFTNISAGIRKGVDALTDPSLARNGVKRIMVVVTDGYPSRDQGQEVTATNEAVAEGIQVHALSFGADADGTLMEQVATAGGGIYAHANDARELDELFQQLAKPTVFLTK